MSKTNWKDYYKGYQPSTRQEDSLLTYTPKEKEAAMAMEGAIEIEGVRADGDCVSVDRENPEFYAVYFRGENHLAQWLEDFPTVELARQYANELSKLNQCKIWDYTKGQARQ